MTAFADAVAGRDWERTALYLLYGLTRRTAALPPGALAELLTLLAADAPPSRQRHARPERRPRRRGGDR